VNVVTDLEPTRALFSESAGRALVSLPAARTRNLVDAARRHGVAVSLLGRVAAGRLAVSVEGAPAFDLPVSHLVSASEEAFAKLVEVHR